MSQVEPAMKACRPIPDELESARGKLVYLYLEVSGDASLDELANALDLPLITLCSLLDTLESRGIVRRDGNRYRSNPSP